MADRKSKYAVSARDKISSIGGNILLNIILFSENDTRYDSIFNLGDTMKNLNENFTTEFLKYADEYNVYPLPRIVVSFRIEFL